MMLRLMRLDEAKKTLDLSKNLWMGQQEGRKKQQQQLPAVLEYY